MRRPRVGPTKVRSLSCTELEWERVAATGGRGGPVDVRAIWSSALTVELPREEGVRPAAGAR